MTQIDPQAPALSFEGLHKEFKVGFRLKRVQAVRGVTLDVEQGQIFGYLGPNGAGKTTTMKMAMSLIQPTAGSVRLFGRPAEDAAVRQHIGYLPEHPYFYDYLTAFEVVDFYGKLFRIPRKVRHPRVDQLLDRVGLGHAKHRRLRGFSKGMLQRVGIAQALVNDPRLVVMDEPMSGLDPVGRHEVRELIAALRAEGKTIFLSSHILHDIETLCDRVAILRDGAVERVGALRELLEGDGSLTDIVAAGVPEAARPALEALGARLTEGPQGLTVAVETARAQEALRLLVEAGAQVLTVNAHRETLEQFFMRRSEGDARAA